MTGPEASGRDRSNSSRATSYGVAVLCLVAAILAAATLAQAGTSAGRVVHVTIGEYVIALEPATVHSGRVTFLVTNTGLKGHEFVILRSRVGVAHLPLDGDEVQEDSSAARNVGEIGRIASGQTKRLTLTLQAGRYVAICNYPGHFHHGMHANLRVR
jgi:uncharacterized cupredoxin-like copper-binding protein